MPQYEIFSLGALRVNSATIRQSGSGDLAAPHMLCTVSLAIIKESIGKVTIKEKCKAPTVTVEQSGSGDTVCNNTDAQTLKLNNSSVGSIKISGIVRKASVVNTGSGDCNLSKLTTEQPLRVTRTSIGKVINDSSPYVVFQNSHRSGSHGIKRLLTTSLLYAKKPAKVVLSEKFSYHKMSTR